MNVFLQYPFELIAVIIVIVVALTKNLGWAVFSMYALAGVAYMFKVGGFEQFATGVLMGVVANEVTHIIRKKPGKVKLSNTSDDLNPSWVAHTETLCGSLLRQIS